MVRAKRSGAAAIKSLRKRTQNDADEQVENSPPKRRNTRTTAEQRFNNGAHSHHSEYDFPSDEDEDEAKARPVVKAIPNKIKQPPAATIPKNGNIATPKARRTNGLGTATPSKATASATAQTPRWKRNDRSARKKSARALIEKVVGGDGSDEEVDEDIAREIYESSEDEEDDGEEEGETIPDEAATPSGKRPRGRPRLNQATKQNRKKSPTPPRDLPPHELYFAQNRPGTSKTSGNTLISLKLLTHEEYFSTLREYQDPHDEDIEFLQSIHVASFPQWTFEVSQDFSVCLYGYGSKRALLHKFAKYLYDKYSDHTANKIVVINGYVRTSSLREVLSTIASAVNPSHKMPAGNPVAMLDSVKALLSSHEVTVTVIMNSIDAVPLRKGGIQAVLAQLAAHPNIRLVCSADTPDFSLLWDSSLRSSFNFVFHDCTTFAPFTAELEVVDDVHELLGRKARRLGGKEGVTYVLRSLPENAKNLFRLLVGEVLAAMDENGGASDEENPGVEYRMLYNKAVEEFICSSEMAFRTLLKE